MIVMVMQVMLMVRLLMLLLVEMVTVMTEVRLDRVPGPHDLRLWPVRQDVQNTEGFHAPLVRVPVPLVLVVRVLHRHHLQPLQGFEIIVRGSRCRGAVAAGPAVHFFIVFLVLFVLPQRRHGIAAAALVGTETSAIGHPIIAASGVAVLVVDHGVPGVASSRTQSLHVLFPGLG